MGMAYAPLSLTVLKEAAPGEEGSATSALQLLDVLGTALGTGVGGAIIAAAGRAGDPGWAGLAGAFASGAVVLLLGLVLTRQMHGSVREGEQRRRVRRGGLKAGRARRPEARPGRPTGGGRSARREAIAQAVHGLDELPAPPVGAELGPQGCAS